MRLGIGGDLVVDPVEASPRLAQRPDGDRPAARRAHPARRRTGVPQPALASRWEGNDAADGLPVPPRPRGAPSPAAGRSRPRTSSPRSSGSSRRATRRWPRCPSRRSPGFRAFVEGEADARQRPHRPRRPRPSASASRRPCRCCPQVLSSPLLSVVDAETIDGDDLAELDLSGAWAVASADDDDLLLERREGAPGRLGGRGAAAATTTRRPPTTPSTTATSTGPPCRPSRYEEAVDDYGDGAFAPFQAELFFGMNLSSPNLDSGAAARGHRAGHRPRRHRRGGVRRPRRSALRRSSPPASSATTPTAARSAPTTRMRRRTSSTSSTPTARCRPSASTSTSRTPSRRWPRWSRTTSRPSASPPSSGRCRSRSTRTSWSPATRQLFSFGWIGAYGSPDAYLAPLFGSAANDNLTNYRSARVDGLLRRARASDAPPRRTPSAGPAAETDVLRGRGRRPDRPVPHPGRGRRPGRGPHHGRRRHRRLGPGPAHRLTRHRLAAPAGRRVR